MNREDYVKSLQERMIGQSYVTLFAHAAVRAIYYRGDQQCSVKVIPTRRRPRDQSAGVLISDPSVGDFLLRVEEIAVFTEPRFEDVIEVVDQRRARSRHRVLAPEPEVPAWEWSDPAKTVARIHTKQI